MSATGQVATLNGGAFARPSTATYLDAGGNLITVGVDVLRPNYSGGIATGALIEGFGINVVTNPRAEGAVVGTVGSGGVYPTGWATFADAGLSRQIVGSGYVNGIPYCDLRYFGTSSGGTFFVDAFQVTATAAPNQVWTTSFWLAIVGGSIANITSFFIEPRANNNPGDVAITPTGTLTRYQGSMLTTSGTTDMSACLHFEVPLGTAVDFTVRVGAPQCELVSNTGNLVAGVAANNGSATSVILPPIGSPAASTRAPDTVGYSRASTANYFDYTGTLTSAVANFLRPSYDTNGNPTGNLIEGFATNLISNNTMLGAVAGVLGSGGSLPTNWVNLGGAHVTETIIGTGTQNGVNYVDIRFSGTTDASFNVLAFETTDVSSSAGVVWSESFYLALIGGTFTNVTSVAIDQRWIGGSPSLTDTIISPTATLTRYSATTASSTGTTATNPCMSFAFSAGVAVDFTLRIGMPQLELGSSATSVITTSGSTVTRAADTFTALGIPLVMEQLTGVAGTGQVGTLTVPSSGSVTLTGVAGTGQVGTLHAEIDKALAGVTGTGQVGTLAAEIDKALAGVTGTGQVGTLTTETDDSPALTGVTGTGQVGTLHAEIDKALAGVTGTGQVGTLAAESDKAIAGVTGTGQVGTLTTETDDSPALTGVTGTGQVGTLAAESDKALTGVTGTGQVGTLVAEIDKALAGVTGTGQVGTLVAEIDDSAAITGVLATGQVGTVTAEIDIPLTGVSGAGQVGVLSTGGNQNATVSGVSATGQVGTVTAEIDIPLSGVAATGTVGTVAVEIDASLTGVEAAGQVGTLTVSTSGNADVSITGVQAIGQVGTLTASGGEVATVTGSGEDARRKYLDWKQKQKQQKRDKAAPTPAPRTPPAEPKAPKPLAVSSELAAQLLAQNLANQRAQLQREIGDIFSEEQQAWANDEDEAMALLLLEAVI